MDPLKAFGLCALLASAPQTGQNCSPVEHVSSPLIDRWQSEIACASRRFGVPEDWIRAVIKQESAGLTTLNGQPITSRAGAMGLMQLVPATWLDMRDRYGLGNNPFDPGDNVLAGTAYLREMYNRYGYPDLFAAYHAGPGRVDRFLAGLKPLPDATLAYLESIVPGVDVSRFLIRNSASKPTKSSQNSLFFVLPEGENSAPQSPDSDSKSAKSESKANELIAKMPPVRSWNLFMARAICSSLSCNSRDSALAESLESLEICAGSAQKIWRARLKA